MSEPSSSNSSDFNCTNGKVRIFIRSPTTPLPEGFSVLTSPDSSVLALKQAIYETHPQKPNVRDQKLIYRGRVLIDSDTIVNVLKNGLESDQTFHLVVKPSFQTIAETTGIPISPPSSISSSQSIRLSQENTANTTNPQINTQFQNQNHDPNGLVDFSHQIPYIYTPPNFAQHPYFVPPENAQTAQVQNQFPNNPQQQLPIPMNHNFFPMGQCYFVMINGIPYIAQYPYPYPYQYILTPQIGTQAQQPFVAQIPDPPQDVAARNQRRATSLWLIVKLFFFVYIFSQNASAERMILLYISALVIFLYQTGRLRIVRRRRQRIIVPMPNELFAQQPPQAPTVPQAQPHTQSDQNNIGLSTPPTSEQSPPSSSVSNDSSINNASSSSSEQQNINANSDSNSANEMQPPPQENARSITLQDIEHALWTFVTSLIPTNPPDVGQQDDVGM